MLRTILVIDLEAACFEGCATEDMEMIELGACLFDAEGELLSEFSLRVKPEHRRVLPYCTAVTGLTPTDLNAAPSGQLQPLPFASG